MYHDLTGVKKFTIIKQYFLLLDMIDIGITIENSKNDVDIIFMTVFWKGGWGNK